MARDSVWVDGNGFKSFAWPVATAGLTWCVGKDAAEAEPVITRRKTATKNTQYTLIRGANGIVPIMVSPFQREAGLDARWIKNVLQRCISLRRVQPFSASARSPSTGLSVRTGTAVMVRGAPVLTGELPVRTDRGAAVVPDR